ncbi:SDR family NAD(P)-dependent oxidoreductase [Arthrobacter sp. AZCC_0090]|uniref:SDR family NAD(P)-dependent oxidoreductase n=1 Tax=Arthrobacter sp. AZCC_0090 TaxID=2735881 RepID=UPI001614EF83|nr:SDR family oxidoreductase [Arthrobacter sp. AZCC_0090]MBB6405659.1 dihydroanticapsin dehydrogenase [Arthrobacter sp. AZCC_0090]
MELGLAGKVVIITGAASGIGRACARAFAAEGASVALIDVDNDAGSSLQRELAGGELEAGASCMFVRADITDPTHMEFAVQSVAHAFGGIDIAVGCAGISGPVGVALQEVGVAEFERVMSVNVTGQFLLAQQCAPFLKLSNVGAMVLLASDSSFVAAPGMVPYNASKGAVLQLTRALSVELEPDGIRVNCVCPSVVDTPMARADLGHTSETFAAQKYPVQTAEQVANHVLYLASPVSAPVNGTSLVSDYGYLAQSSFPA